MCCEDAKEPSNSDIFLTQNLLKWYDKKNIQNFIFKILVYLDLWFYDSFSCFQCRFPGCSYIAAPKLVQLHITWVCTLFTSESTVLPARSDSDVMFCLQSHWGLRIYRSLMYQYYPVDRINT